MGKKRFVLLVLDGLGVGEMPDVKAYRPADCGAHTLKNIISQNNSIRIPSFRALGILEYFIRGRFNKMGFNKWNCSLGKFSLAHFGADSFMGHQEIAGSKPKKPLQQFIAQKKNAIIFALQKQHILSRYERGLIQLNGKAIVVSDNIESDYGYNMNVVGSLDHSPYDEILRVGKIVRSVVDVGRVITMGGRGFDHSTLAACREHKIVNGNDVYGINIPKLHIYDEYYQVVHLGLPMNRSKQTPHILSTHGFPVVLIGKAADVLSAEQAEYHPVVHTEEVLSCLIKKIKEVDNGLIFANVQETDLAGHSQNVLEYSRHLELVDAALPSIFEQLSGDDLFLITGDHGNDPTIGHSFHTREYTPLILFSKKIIAQNFGTRKTLADIGASICSFFSQTAPEFGTSFIPL